MASRLFFPRESVHLFLCMWASWIEDNTAKLRLYESVFRPHHLLRKARCFRSTFFETLLHIWRSQMSSIDYQCFHHLPQEHNLLLTIRIIRTVTLAQILKLRYDFTALESLTVNFTRKIMANYICPACGSEYFVTSKTGSKSIFNVRSEHSIQLIQSATDSIVDVQKIFCGACSWQGDLAELVESHRD